MVCKSQQCKIGLHTDIFDYAEWPRIEAGQSEVEFHLVYQGKLPAASQSATRAREKHDIRKVFHRQLASLWDTHPFLVNMFKEKRPGYEISNQMALAQRYARCGYHFLPLISGFFSLACSLDILFLRRDGPGSLVKSGGDIDNRIKVLFDALRMPQTCDEICGDSPAEDETPFFCLLEDDKLISKVQIDTNWLLTPATTGERVNDVQLVIRVKTVVTGSDKYEAVFV